MTLEFLIAEGRRLARPCLFLRPEANGPVVAIWHDPDTDEIEETGFRCWITVDTRFVPGLATETPGFLSIYTDEQNRTGGRIEAHSSQPNRSGTELYAVEESVLPPLEVIFTLGSAAIEEWLNANNWSRHEPYNSNFRDHETADAYLNQWMKEYPVYRQDGTYAVIGGWHMPFTDDDWLDFVNEQLLVLTVEDPEPWVEAWLLSNGESKVIQRIT